MIKRFVIFTEMHTGLAVIFVGEELRMWDLASNHKSVPNDFARSAAHTAAAASTAAAATSGDGGHHGANGGELFSLEREIGRKRG